MERAGGVLTVIDRLAHDEREELLHELKALRVEVRALAEHRAVMTPAADKE